MKFSSSCLLDPWLGCPCACRRRHLFSHGIIKSICHQWYREPDGYRNHAYTNRGHLASGTHAGQSHLPKSHRGSSRLFCFASDIYIRIIQSPGIGSSNPSRSHTSLSLQPPRMAHLILCNCTQMSAEVRESRPLRPIVFHQLRCRMELG